MYQINWKRKCALCGVVVLIIAAILVLEPSFSKETPDILFIAPTTSGNFSLKDHLGDKHLLINFWASWCTPCKEEMPLLEQFQKDNEGVMVIGVNTGDTRRMALKKIEEWGITFQIVFDQRARIREAYQVMGMPQTYLLSPQGEIIWSKKGILYEEDMKELERRVT